MSVATPERTSSKRETTPQAEAISSTWTDRIDAVGRHTVRYGLVLVLLWIGGMKFTA